jgi:predicted kinase
MMSDALTEEQLQGQKMLRDSLPLITIRPRVSEGPSLPRTRKKPKLIVLVGLSGSGKSTLALKMAVEKPRHIRINRDALRLMVHGREWYPRREADVTALEEMLIRGTLAAGNNAIVDATNLHPRSMERMQHYADTCGAQLVIQDMNVDLDECIQRAATRARKGIQPGIIRPIIERQALQYGRVPWPKDRKIVIFDLDGTAADLTHRLKYLHRGDCPECNGSGEYQVTEIFNISGPCGFCKGEKTVKRDNVRFLKESINDIPVKIIVEWMRELFVDHYVVIVSGRSLGLCGKETILWLDRHSIRYHRLFMRDANDHRQDTEVKQSILDMMLASGLPKEQIAFVVDDRLSVCRMWKENGLRIIPVRCSERDFE